MRAIRKVVIVGGGSAGWMTAAALSKFLPHDVSVELVESEQLGTISVGEATIPPIITFNRMLGIDEDEFLRATDGTIKWGIQFESWGGLGEKYMHPFGDFGTHIGDAQFFHYWQKLNLLGKCQDLESFSIAACAAKQAKFARRPVNPTHSIAKEITYAYHFDAIKYAKFLREYAEPRGVTRIEGMVDGVKINTESGCIESLTLKSGKTISGDLFVDCSGFKAMLIGGALRVEHESWSDQLLCDRAVAIQSSNEGEKIAPFTRSVAHGCGWRWVIPLQSRIGNGLVYHGDMMSDDEAVHTLRSQIAGNQISEPNTIRLKIGKRKLMWHKNCVAIGLSAGFLEPLESTGLHLIQRAITHLLTYFPHQGFAKAAQDRFNREMDFEMEGVKDFIILHYHCTGRRDTDFWRHCATMDIPESLRNRLDLYRDTGMVVRDKNELFGESNWLAVMHGQGIRATAYHPLVDAMPEGELRARVDDTERLIRKMVSAMSSHDDFLKYLSSRNS